MKKRIILLAVVFMVLSATAFAEDTPKIVSDGMAAYKVTGFEAAFNIWLKNSPMDSDKEAIKSLKGTITHVEGLYGKMVGYEILMNVRISKTTIRTYAEVSFEKGPLFFYFDCYKTATGWTIPIIRFHSEVDRILPESIINRK